MSICIVPAEFHEPRFDRFTMGEVKSVVNQRWFDGAAFKVRNANSSFTPSSMIVVIFLMSIVAIVKKERFN